MDPRPHHLHYSLTDPAHVAGVVDHLRRTFAAGGTRSLEWRLQQLKELRRLLHQHRTELEVALKKDLGHRPDVAMTLEYDMCCQGELQTAIHNVKSWMQPERRPTPPVLFPSSAMLVREPKGVVLIMAPWNYPLHLLLNPFIGALAAGCAVVLKPSEHAPHVARALAETIPLYLDTAAIAVITGGIEVAEAALACQFDHIFFTGSPSVGRRVLAAAAPRLTPCTLELGGKSPCVVDAGARLLVAARRIAAGKFVNCGQSCVAPDYVLAHQSIVENLVVALRRAILEFFGPNPQTCADYSRIVSESHTRRLQALLQGAHGGQVVLGGQVDVVDRYVAPTVVVGPHPGSELMQEEIFGPILPVLSVASVGEAVRFIAARPRPLAAYVFSEHRPTIDLFREQVIAGAIGINDTVMQVLAPSLPFGGTGNSGMGRYHGRASFDTFSNEKAVLETPTLVDLPLRYAPYTPAKLRLVRFVARLTGVPGLRRGVLAVLLALGALLLWWLRRSRARR